MHSDHPCAEGTCYCRVLATRTLCLSAHPDFTLPRPRSLWHNEVNFSTFVRRCSDGKRYSLVQIPCQFYPSEERFHEQKASRYRHCGRARCPVGAGANRERCALWP